MKKEDNRQTLAIKGTEVMTTDEFDLGKLMEITRKTPIVPSFGNDLKNLHDRHRIGANDPRIKECQKEVIKSLENFQKALDVCKIGIQLHYKSLVKSFYSRQHEDMRKWAAVFRPVILGKTKGIFELEHILTLVTSLRYYLDEKNKSILIWGACQLGKTMVFCGLFCFVPAIEWVLNGRMVVPFINTPNFNNLSDSTKQELEQTLKIYGSVEVRAKDVLLPEGVEVLMNDQPVTLGLVERVKDDFWNHENSTAKGWNQFVLQRNLPNVKNTVEQIIDKCKQFSDNLIVVNFTDEIHNGSGLGGCSDLLETQLMDRSIIPEGLQLRRIGISATPSEIFSKKSWRIIPMWVGPDYWGLIYYWGKRLFTILKGTDNPLPEIKSIEATFPELAKSLDKLKELDSPEYECIETYFYALHEHISNGITKAVDFEDILDKEMEVLKEKHRCFKIQQDRLMMVIAQELWKVYKSLVNKDKPLFFVRIFKRTAVAKRLYDRLCAIQQREGMEATHKVLQYFGELSDDFVGNKNQNRRTVKDVLIDEYINKNHFCMIMAVGRGRMGDSYPSKCSWYLETTENSVTWDTIIQATYGRSMGYNKHSTCFFRDQYAEELKQFIADNAQDLRVSVNGDNRKKAGCRTRYGNAGAGRPKVNISYSL